MCVRVFFLKDDRLVPVKAHIRNVQKGKERAGLAPDVLRVASFSHEFLDVIHRLSAAHSSQLLCDLVEGVLDVPSHVTRVSVEEKDGECENVKGTLGLVMFRADVYAPADVDVSVVHVNQPPDGLLVLLQQVLHVHLDEVQIKSVMRGTGGV